MKTITIHIHELGAIRDSVIQLSQVMIFSGESGLGKSYLVMLCHYFFDLLLNKHRLHRFIEEKGWSFNDMRPSFKGSGTALIIQKKELEEWIAEDAMQYLSYMLNHDLMTGHLTVELPAELGEEIPVSFEEEITGIQNNEDVYVKLSALNVIYRTLGDSLGEESSFAYLLRYALIQLIFGNISALRNAYVFPPSRGPMMTEDLRPQTGLYEQFRDNLQQFSRIPPHPERVDEDLIALFQQVLDGNVTRTQDVYQYTTQDYSIPISAAAASIRELAPLALLVERTDISTSAMMIEEPEAHLHPLKQRTMADITSVMCRGGAYMQITSHSDYYLRRINELISLHKLHKKCQTEEEYQSICNEVRIDPRLEFNSEVLTAYLLVRCPDGTSRVEQQSLENGVPFSSFSQAIDDSLYSRYMLDKIAEKYECR